MHVQTDNKLAGPNLVFQVPSPLEIRNMDPKASIPKYNIGTEYVNSGIRQTNKRVPRFLKNQ